MKGHLTPNERVEADKGYAAEWPESVKVPGAWIGGDKQRKCVGGRHETVNKRFKDWGCLKETLKHNFARHSSMFRAVAVVSQLCIMNGEPLFAVDYDDTR